MTTEEIRQEIREQRMIRSELVLETQVRGLLERGYLLVNPDFTWDEVDEQ